MSLTARPAKVCDNRQYGTSCQVFVQTKAWLNENDMFLSNTSVLGMYLHVFAHLLSLDPIVIPMVEPWLIWVFVFEGEGNMCIANSA